jgi:hypothetical protein
MIESFPDSQETVAVLVLVLKQEDASDILKAKKFFNISVVQASNAKMHNCSTIFG